MANLIKSLKKKLRLIVDDVSTRLENEIPIPLPSKKISGGEEVLKSDLEVKTKRLISKIKKTNENTKKVKKVKKVKKGEKGEKGEKAVKKIKPVNKPPKLEYKPKLTVEIPVEHLSLSKEEHGDVIKDTLLNELTSAEELYGQLIGKVSERKLGSLRLKIDSLRSKLREDMIDHVEMHEEKEYVDLDYVHPEEKPSLNSNINSNKSTKHDTIEIVLTQGSLDHSYLIIPKGFFPEKYYGGSNASSLGEPICFLFNDNKTFYSDYDSTKGFLRNRTAVKSFFKKNGLKLNSSVYVSKLAEGKYLLNVDPKIPYIKNKNINSISKQIPKTKQHSYDEIKDSLIIFNRVKNFLEEHEGTYSLDYLFNKLKIQRTDILVNEVDQRLRKDERIAWVGNAIRIYKFKSSKRSNQVLPTVNIPEALFSKEDCIKAINVIEENNLISKYKNLEVHFKGYAYSGKQILEIAHKLKSIPWRKKSTLECNSFLRKLGFKIVDVYSRNFTSEKKDSSVIILNDESNKKNTIDDLDNIKLTDNDNIVGKCPTCKDDLIIKVSRFGRYLSCGNCITVSTFKKGHIVSTNYVCEECTYPLIDLIFKGSNKKRLCVNINCKTNQIGVGEACPKCKKGKLKLRVSMYGAFLGCDKYPSCSYHINTLSDIKKDISNEIKSDIVDVNSSIKETDDSFTPSCGDENSYMCLSCNHKWNLKKFFGMPPSCSKCGSVNIEQIKPLE